MARSWRSQIADEVRATSRMKPKPMDEPVTDASTTGAVERFDPYTDEGNREGYGEMEVQADGEWVRFTDYQAAIQRAEAAENDALKFYFRCERAAYAFQRGDMKEAERQIMGLPGEDVPAAQTARLDAELERAVDALQPLKKAAREAGLQDRLDGIRDAEDRIRALRRAAPTEGEAQSLDDTTRAVLDRAERIVAGQSQQEQRTAEIFLRPTEGEA